MKIVKGKIPSAKKVVIYGPEGIGKSTFAAQFPEPLFIDTEGSTKSMDVARFEPPRVWPDIFDAVQDVINDPSVCKTLVIDTADWAEMLCSKFVCQKNGVQGIEDIGYGKGYVYLQETFKTLLDKLEQVIAAGVNVVFTAHAAMRKFEQPDEMGAYDRWEMKLTKKTAPMLKEWADMVLFANYKTVVVTDDKTHSKKAQGGKRVMYATHNPCWDAKNRDGLDDCLPFEYKAIKSVIEGTAAKPKKEAPKAEQKEEQEPAAEPEAKEPEVIDHRAEIVELRKLMAEDGIDEARLMMACALKGVCFSGAKLEELTPGFILESLIAKWPGFVRFAKKVDMNAVHEVPFKD